MSYLTTRQTLGRHGERLAEDFLRKKGFTILERNWRTRWGEIDIIAAHGNALHFVEVKTRSSTGFGEPHEAVHSFKYRQLLVAAEAYIARRIPAQRNFQIDAVSILLDQANRIAKIQHFENITL